MQFIFDSHGGDSQLDCRTGQCVRVIRALTEQEADIEDVGKMFRIEFPDGYETDAFADELTLDTLDEPTCFAATHWLPMDAIWAAEEQGVLLTEEQAIRWWKANEKTFLDALITYGNMLLSQVNFKKEV